MQLSPEVKTKIQIVLVLAIVIAAGHTAYGLYQRSHEQAKQAPQAAPPLNPDYYVTPKKLYPYDLKSARELTKMPTWVKEGYRYYYYPYNRAAKRTDFTHEAGLLLPIQRLQIKDVVTDVAPSSQGQKVVMAVFEQGGKSYAFQIGLLQNGMYKIYSDQMLYIQDPRELYKHWSPEVWQSIEKHEVKPGMNEMQAVFAVGMGTPTGKGSPAWKTAHYPNGGKPLTITYHDGKATEIKESTSA